MVKEKRFTNRVIWILTCTLFVFFVIFRTYLWGKYFLLAVSVAIFLLSLIGSKGKIFIGIHSYHKFMLIFIAYTLISSLWALNSNDSITQAVTLFLILICASMLYCHYIRFDSVHQILTAIMWAGFIVSIYSIMYYGVDVVIEALYSRRLAKGFDNVNSLALFLAVCCTIQASEFINKRRRLLVAIMMIPEVLVIAATQSRTALVYLVLGVVGVYFLNCFDLKSAKKTIKTVLILFVICIVILYAMTSITAFSGISNRLMSLFNSFTGEGEVDHSTQERNAMISLGWQYFLKNPFCGIGIGCPHILNAEYIGHDAYLHNNFVELLCGGGIFGFIAFYSRYIYIFVNLIKYRKADKEHFCVCFVLLFSMIISEWGSVTYLEKLPNYYFLMQILNIQCLKSKARSVAGDENPKIV